jgi:transposase-like protein
VWLYHRFPLSLRDVEEMMAERGVSVSYDTIHQWCRKFGQTYANRLRRYRPRPGDKWHLDEVFIKIAGQTHHLWRAVDQQGTVLDILVTSRRDAKAATWFFRRLLTGLEYVPRVLVTDKLASYGVARRRLMPGVEHRRSKYLNNRAENSHQPTRARTGDEKSHLTGRRAAVSVRVQRDIATLPAPPPPAACRRIPPRDGHPIHHLEPDRRPVHHRLTQATMEPGLRQSLVIMAGWCGDTPRLAFSRPGW